MFYYSIPVAISQSYTVLSNANTSSLESGKKATDLIQLLYSSSIRSSTPVAAFQSRIVLPYNIDASSLESGKKATGLTESLYSSVRSSVPVAVFQSHIVLPDTDASSLESGEKATNLT
jgi:hypothetical protein